MERFPHRIQAVKTDNHSTFTNAYTGTNKRSDMTVKRIHPLDVFCLQNNIIHYLIDKGKPNQSVTVEESTEKMKRSFNKRMRSKVFVICKRKLECGIITTMT